MRLTVKRKLIDDINEAFISIAAKNKSRSYSKYLNEINREMLNNIENLDARKVKSIIDNASLKIDDTALLFMILSAITLLISNQRLTKKEKLPLLPIIAVMGIYKITKPKRFVEKIYKINSGVKLNDNEKRVKGLISSYTKDNISTFNKIKRETTKQLEKSTRKASTTTGRNMLKDLKILRDKNISINDMEKQLDSKYKITDVERTLNTELHSQAELAKNIHAVNNGFTHKQWKTQGDARVRQTRWHNAVTNKTIPVDSEFRATGLVALAPGDTRLPPKERIRCRCYLVYSTK